MSYKVPPVKGSSIKVRRRFWRKVIADQQASNMTASGFCRQHDLREKDFRRWKSRLNKLSAKGTEGEVNIVPINIKSENIKNQERLENYAIDIRLVSGCVICIKTPVRLQELRALIEELK